MSARTDELNENGVLFRNDQEKSLLHFLTATPSGRKISEILANILKTVYLSYYLRDLICRMLHIKCHKLFSTMACLFRI